MTHRIKTIAIAAVASALTVAGMAVAHDNDDKGDRHSGSKPFAFAGGPGGKAFTYSETHFRKGGEDVVVRVDQGDVLATSASAISIRRNDGETVEVPVDGDTKVFAGWRKHVASASHKRDAGVAQLSVGKRVFVFRTDADEAAEAVTVAWRFHHHGGRWNFDDRDDDGSHHDRHDD